MLAVITGASAGIGASFARKLAARGWDLLLVARREHRLCALARELHSDYRVTVNVLAADLTDDRALELAAGRVRHAENLGLLVNNAGFGAGGFFADTDPHRQDAMARLHVVAVTRLTHAALANLAPRAQAGTGVINVSSIAAFLAGPQAALYHSTKTWMNRFTEGIALELAARNSPVTMQALCPGFTLSEFHDTTGRSRASMPGWLWMPPDFVVDESLRGFERRELIVIPARRYRWIVRAIRTIPVSWIRWGGNRLVNKGRQS